MSCVLLFIYECHHPSQGIVIAMLHFVQEFGVYGGYQGGEVILVNISELF